jgi:hypothetical protein
MSVLEVGRYHPQIFRVSSMHGFRIFQIFLEAQRERNAMDVQDLKQMP